MITKALILVFSVVCLSQCANQAPHSNHADRAYQSSDRPLTNEDSGKVISESYYEIDGVRKVQRRILVTATPRLETRLETRILGTTW